MNRKQTMTCPSDLTDKDIDKIIEEYPLTTIKDLSIRRKNYTRSQVAARLESSRLIAVKRAIKKIETMVKEVTQIN